LNKIKKINFVFATIYSIVLIVTETIMNFYWDDWKFYPLWIVDYLIALILLSSVFVFKNKLQNLLLLLGWSFSSGVTYMALFVSLDPNGLNSPDIETKIPLIIIAFMVSILGIILTFLDIKLVKSQIDS
tara:strand:- start:1018 stop:1404 length:387 start_codon:yes stop_codon:yes gene_type:complete